MQLPLRAETFFRALNAPSDIGQGAGLAAEGGTRTAGGICCSSRQKIRAVEIKSNWEVPKMAKKEDRVKVTLACTECKQRNYDTKKNKKNDPDRLEMNKYCKFCRKHTLHKETK